MINWLYTSTLDSSLLIGLVWLIRTPVRRWFGANIAYLLWAIPLLPVLMPLRFERPALFFEPEVSVGAISLEPASLQVFYLPGGIPFLELWLGGVVLCLMLQWLLQRRLHQVLHNGSQAFPILDDAIHRLITDNRMDSTRIRTSAFVTNPCLFGLRKPDIYLPENFAVYFSPQEQFWILKHELTHLRRGDLWVQAVGELLRAVYWFNPIVHLALRSLREDQEMACDQATLAGCDDTDHFTYGKTLLRSSVPTLIPSVLTFFTTTKERFTMLRNRHFSKLNTLAGLTLCTLLGAFALTSAPESIAQSDLRPAFADVYDANLPRRFAGVIVRVDYGQHFTLLHVDATDDSGVVQWVVEGASWQEMHDAGLDSNALYPGRQVTVTGYQSKDQSCDPKCRLNGRDLSLED